MCGRLFGLTPAEDPTLVYVTLNVGFESGIPDDWMVRGTRTAVTNETAHGAGASVRIGTAEGVNWNVSEAAFRFTVPSNGKSLTFWVKRKSDPALSIYNKHGAWLKDSFGLTNLKTFYYDSYNDTNWQQMTADLTTYAGQSVILVVAQHDSSSNYHSWTYLDDVTVLLEGVADPTISPKSGAYVGKQTIKMHCDTLGVSITYTLDGSTPTASSTLYVGPFELIDSVTVKAIGVKTGEISSKVVSATYAIECSDGFFGAKCTEECPGGVATPCSLKGVCDDGKAGAGTCACDPGWGGPVCASPVCGDGLILGGETCEKGGSGFAACCDPVSCQLKSKSVVCRETKHQCDQAEFCPGSSDTCPPDAPLPDQTSCCVDGVCSAGTTPDCSGHEDQCNTGVCASLGSDKFKCLKDSSPHEGASCNADSDGCTVADSCSAGTCAPGSAPDCSAHNDECNIGLCVSTAGDSFECLKTPLEGEANSCDDGDECTLNDLCRIDGTCSGEPDPKCIEPVDEGSTSDVVEQPPDQESDAMETSSQEEEPSPAAEETASQSPDAREAVDLSPQPSPDAGEAADLSPQPSGGGKSGGCSQAPKSGNAPVGMFLTLLLSLLSLRTTNHEPYSALPTPPSRLRRTSRATKGKPRATSYSVRR